jgi:hypothetical protein
MATVFCAWDMNYVATHGSGYILTPESANTLLTFLEPIQVGYGAVVCFKPFAPVTSQLLTFPPIDTLLPRGHPLGSGVGRLWRTTALPSIRNRRISTCSSMADTSTALRNGIRSAISCVYAALFRG